SHAAPLDSTENPLHSLALAAPFTPAVVGLEFNIPDNDVVGRGRAEENRSASFSKGHGTDLTVVAS
ncbi:hypothetical protein FQN60_015118, partial [Etheostoma spectabile]